MSRILVVEDDTQIARALAINLKARKYDVDLAPNGSVALDLLARRHSDAVLLDLGLPDMDGSAVIEGIRGWSDVPILVVSARHDGRDKIQALDLGADDFVEKPFAMDELLARLRAALRRSAGTSAQRPEVARVSSGDGRLVIDLSATRVTLDSEPVHVTPIEWRILELFAKNPDRLISQRELLHRVWGPGYEGERHYSRVYISQLRQKLEDAPSAPRWFRTEAGMGYRFTPSGLSQA